MFTFVRVGLQLEFSPSRKQQQPFYLFSLASRLENDCRGSSLHESLYGRRLPDDPLAVKRFQKPSTPIIISPPVMMERGGYGADRLHRLELVLIGTSAIHAVPVLLRLETLLERFYGASVRGMCLEGAYDQQEIIRDDLMKGEPLPLAIVTLDDLTQKLDLASAGKGIRLRFNTPLRLIRNGMMQQRPTGADIIRSLLRRVSSLAYHYCDYELGADYRSLSQLAGEVDSDNSGLRSLDGDIRGGEGVVGELVFRGDMEPLLPFLAAGSMVHLGKGAAAGYGCYELHPGV